MLLSRVVIDVVLNNKHLKKITSKYKNMYMKKRFKKSMSFTSSIVILSAFGLITPSVYAYGRVDNALNYGYGCHGDQACREERQVRMGGANFYHRGQRNGKGMQAYHGNSAGKKNEFNENRKFTIVPSIQRRKEKYRTNERRRKTRERCIYYDI